MTPCHVQDQEKHMDFHTPNMSVAASMVTRQTKTVSVETKTTETDVTVEKKSLIDEIREKGFQAFLQDLEQKKLEDLRKKILGSMGLDDETLLSMPADQRTKIEKMVSQEIIKRMLANAQMSTEGGTTLVAMQTVQVDVRVVSSTSRVAGGLGMEPLLALQETEFNRLKDEPNQNKNAG